MKITLKEFIDQCQEYTEQGYEVYIEGQGDMTWRLVVQDKVIRIGDEIGTTNA